MGDFRNVISIKDFSRQDLNNLIKEAIQIKANGTKPVLKGHKAALLFFEASTRTRMSFETAARNLGFKVSGFAGKEGTSVSKGEPLIDTVRMFRGYGNEVIIIRHNLDGAARFVADNIDVPVINGGDSATNHPTQTMLDLMTIKERFGRIDGLKIALVGDLKYGRTVHSILQALELYDVEITLVSPRMLAMPEWRIQDFETNTKRKIIINPGLDEVIQAVDVLYMTRIQKERFPKGAEGESEYEKVSGIYNLTAEMLRNAKPELAVMHPLPRYKFNLELGMDVDELPQAAYIEQAANGLHMRTALLLRVFGKGFKGRNQQTVQQEKLWKNLPIPDGKKQGKHFVYKINNGTLIDHIESGKGFEVMRVLGLEEYDKTAVVYARNLNSSQFGRKDVIGVQDHELSDEQLSKLALVSSRARVNIIRNDKVYRKGTVILPYELRGLIECQTLKCISNPQNFEFAPSIFYTEQQKPLKVRCHYCDTPVGREEIILK